MRYRGVYGGTSVNIDIDQDDVDVIVDIHDVDIDQDDVDVIVDIHDEFAAEGHEQIARRCIAYLCSDARLLNYAKRQRSVH
jgi:hypothetical protein